MCLGAVLRIDVTRWWPRKDKNSNKVSAQSEGARLLAAYLKIMKWPKVCNLFLYCWLFVRYGSFCVPIGLTDHMNHPIYLGSAC